jgi:hypothetical protein
MIRTSADVYALALICCLFVGFLCMLTGYTLMVRRALLGPDKKRLLKAVFIDTVQRTSDGFSRISIALVPIGALVGLIGLVGLLVMVFTAGPPCAPAR